MWFRSLSDSRKSPLPARPGRLRLERLEDRTVPTTFRVTTALDVVNPADAKLSLREAITKANATPGADVIVVPASPTAFLIEAAGTGEDGNLTGDFDITDSVTIRGAGAAATFIGGWSPDRVFDIIGTGPHSIQVVLQGLTVRRGNVAGDGGGIRVANADLVVRDAAVIDNRASGNGGGICALDAADVTLVRATVGRNLGNGGGGLFVGGQLTGTGSTVRRNLANGLGGGINASAATLTSCTISANTSRIHGGGIHAMTATLTNCTVAGNTASVNGGGINANFIELTGGTVRGNTAGSGSGGGITADSATLTSTTISGNFAGFSGGGINASTVGLTRSTVSDNSAARSGGGIIADLATLGNCTVTGNSAQVAGGGIFATTAGLLNCTVAANTAGTEGGGINAGTAMLLNCTIAENIADVGGGLYHAPGGTFSVKNTIVALNLVDLAGTGPDVAGEFFTSGGHNLIGDGTGADGFTTVIDFMGTSSDPLDPRLGTLKNNGGPTQTMALLAGSPAIDSGDNVANDPVNGMPLTTDQRGFSRKKDGNGNGIAIIDIGAFER
jgi:hypothetical protein